jgi:mono/diheme cytochrome c family protein
MRTGSGRLFHAAACFSMTNLTRICVAIDSSRSCSSLLRNAVETMESSQKRNLAIFNRIEHQRGRYRLGNRHRRRAARSNAGPVVMLAVNLILVVEPDSDGAGSSRARIERQNTQGCNDMRTRWCVIFAASAMMATIDGLHAQPEENPGRNEFLRSCASCHGVSGKGDGPVAKSLRPRPSDLTKLSEANNGVFPVSRVHEVIDGRIERLVHGTRDMPVWGERYMEELISPESPNFVSKEWAEAMVRRRISALVEYISTLQRPKRRSR